jgi:hypothetical protein
VNALSGTALAGVELVVAFAVDAVLLEPTPELIAFAGAVSSEDDGVYATEVVVAFEPAEEDPDEAKEEEAPGPLPPAEALD